MERDNDMRKEQKEAQQQPGNLSSFNNRNPRKSTEAEDAQKGEKKNGYKSSSKPVPGKKEST